MKLTRAGHGLPEAFLICFWFDYLLLSIEGPHKFLLRTAGLSALRSSSAQNAALTINVRFEKAALRSRLSVPTAAKGRKQTSGARAI